MSCMCPPGHNMDKYGASYKVAVYLYVYTQCNVLSLFKCKYHAEYWNIFFYLYFSRLISNARLKFLWLLRRWLSNIFASRVVSATICLLAVVASKGGRLLMRDTHHAGSLAVRRQPQSDSEEQQRFQHKTSPSFSKTWIQVRHKC